MYVLLDSALAETEAARAVVLQTHEKAPWSVGACARVLVKESGVKSPSLPVAESLLSRTGWRYQSCEPGRYNDVTLYDVRSCYYSLLCLLPSPKVTLTADGIEFRPLRGEESVAWAALLDRVKHVKRLRNSLVGVMAGQARRDRDGPPAADAYGRPLPGASRVQYFYHRGERVAFHSGPGPLRTAALLVVRTAWELTALAAAESLAVYANTDCVITKQSVPPSVWIDAKLTVRREAHGTGDICAVGCYQVGRKQTLWHRYGRRPAAVLIPPPTPKVLFSHMWL